MSVTVTHTKVSTIPDGADTTVVRPSDWNATHTLVGLGTAAELNAGVANGVATLDSSGKVPSSQLNALVTSVNGQTGTVVLTNTDISGFGTMSTQNANSIAVTGGSINNIAIGATTASTGAFTTAVASTSVATPIVQATNSGGLSLKNSAGTTQIGLGAGGGDNVSINVSTNLNGTNAQIDISPTGTGHVHIKPAGSGSIEVAPTVAGTMNNMVIGGVTPLAGSFTDLSVTGTTSFDGAQGALGQVLTSAGSGATPTWTTPTTGTVTSVTGTAPVVSSGGTTPAISMAAATTSVSGYLTNTDWTTFNGKQAALVSGTNIKTVNSTSLLGSGDVSVGVTSVTGTAPIVSSGGATPAISMAAANTTTNGYLTSTDWNTFNGKGAGTVTSVAASVPSFLSVAGSPVTSTGTLAISYSGTALPVANGGTGSTTATGTGSVVLATSPTITGLTFTSAASAAPAFYAQMSATQTLSNGTYTLVNFDTKTGGNNFDTNSNFNTTTHLFTPTVAGYYQSNVTMFFNSAGGQVFLLIYKNSAGAIGSSYFTNSVTAGAIASTSAICYCNGSTDTISVYAFQSSGATLAGNGGSGSAFFSAAMIRSA
jgi:hypothetical protein